MNECVLGDWIRWKRLDQTRSDTINTATMRRSHRQRRQVEGRGAQLKRGGGSLNSALLRERDGPIVRQRREWSDRSSSEPDRSRKSAQPLGNYGNRYRSAEQSWEMERGRIKGRKGVMREGEASPSFLYPSRSPCAVYQNIKS